jgi:hypothetical protein
MPCHFDIAAGYYTAYKHYYQFAQAPPSGGAMGGLKEKP